MHRYIFLITILFFFNPISGQQNPFVVFPEQLDDSAFAEWIGPGAENDAGVYYFRKKIVLNSVPEKFIIHVSADNRYRLYVNERLVSWGPAVGDLLNWNYETVDIAPFLVKGKNIIAAQVWNMGSLKGARQISYCTAFILQGNSTTERGLNTNKSWVFAKDSGYHFIKITSEIAGGGYIAGATDSIDGKKHPWEWKNPEYDDTSWKQSIELGKGNHAGLDTWLGTPWLLKARTIPFPEQKKQIIPKILSIKGLSSAETSALKENVKLHIPANSHIEVLFDNQVLTMGFPQLVVQKGRNSKIKVQYQESLFETGGQKGNRSEWKGKEMKGYYDVFLPDGGLRQFEPLWIRTFRYVKLSVETKEEALDILDFYNIYTAYPLQQKAIFTGSDSVLTKIWDAAWRTARLCALETYMDCPYYEQLQYIGDTRIQALISMYVSGDDRLVKNAISQFYGSFQPMGLTKSSHPSDGHQIIPPFSLLFINMMHDYFMLRDDSIFLKQFIPGVKFILDWFVSKIADNGMLGPLPYWNHIDGGTLFTNGSPPGIREGGSAHMSILLAYTIDKAVELFTYFGYACDAEYFRAISNSLKEKTLQLCYNKERNLVAETPEKKIYSQHTNSFAILAGMFSPKDEKEVARKLISDPTLVPATLYFSFYVFQALKKAGYGDEVIHAMYKWADLLDKGFTTFPEHGIHSRSDCHAWSAHPVYDFLNITCGIAPASPGFKTVEIRPQPGNLSFIKASMPHPLGEISIEMQETKNTASYIKIILPNGLKGKLIYKQNIYLLDNGINEFIL